VRLWDVAQRRELAALDHGSAVLGVGFALDGSLLVSASRDGLVRAWAASN
jgi:WD40 repeat protein